MGVEVSVLRKAGRGFKIEISAPGLTDGKEAKVKKKVLALLMAAALTLGICVPAFGDNVTSGFNSNDGSITIENAVVGQEYAVYQILKLESYNAEAKAYAYKATKDWETWLKDQTEYVSFDKQGYVTWVDGADQAAFAKLAQTYAKEKKLSNQGYSKAESETVKFEDLNLGYYLVDTTLGTICSLDTTDPSVTMKEKNRAPENVKQVQEDSKVSNSDEGWGAWNDADINQEVNFQSTVTAQAGAENYVLHDKMSEGLTYGSVTSVTLNGTTVDEECYTVKKENLSDGCTFEVVFTQDFCDTLKADDEIVVSYTATLNENAVVGLPGNPNESYLSYGDSVSGSGDSSSKEPSKTPSSKTITYTWDVEVLKYANGDESKVLKDAQFVLLNSDRTKVATVVNGKLTAWVDVSATGETWPENAVLTTDDNGKIEIDGLDSDTYYLREVKAPAGYNMLSEDVEVKVVGATTESEDETEGSNELTYTTVVAKVNNQSGTELPSTGGIGTTLFYVVGGVLVVGAAVLLVVRRRTANSEE